MPGVFSYRGLALRFQTDSQKKDGWVEYIDHRYPTQIKRMMFNINISARCELKFIRPGANNKSFALPDTVSYLEKLSQADWWSDRTVISIKFYRMPERGVPAMSIRYYVNVRDERTYVLTLEGQSYTEKKPSKDHP
ncbi:MAG: hypothetical protein CL678_15480 [Bdellovibrionaceae bacterium]|nr:hypothetical protein [Pseudobdellovibrionaceae bacterium]